VGGAIMPRIPIVTAQQGPGVLQLPAVQRQNGFEEVSRLGERMTVIQAEAERRMTVIQDKLRQHQEELALYDADTALVEKLQGVAHNLTADPNYEGHEATLRKEAETFVQETVKRMPSPAVAEVFRLRAARRIAETSLDVRVRSTKLIAEQQVVDSINIGERTAKLMARAETPEKRKEIKANQMALWNRNPTLTPAVRDKLKDDWEVDAKTQLKALVRERIEDNAAVTHQTLLSGVYDDRLDKADVVELRNVAKRQMRENEEEAQRVKAEQQEQSEMTLFEQYRTGALTSSGIAASKLPPHKQLFWENALENKREKPFRESDLRVYAGTLKTILQHPDQITPTAILDKMGKGLSIEHTTHALTMWQKATEAKSLAPAQYDPLRQALTMWESMKDSYVFAPDDMLGDADSVRSGSAKPGPKLKLENDLNSQKVLDALIMRAQQGQEPRIALQELVKPYLEREAPSFFARWSSWILGKPAATTDDASLRQQASDFLKSHNIPQTEDGLRRTIEFLKKKGAK